MVRRVLVTVLWAVAVVAGVAVAALSQTLISPVRDGPPLLPHFWLWPVLLLLAATLLVVLAWRRRAAR